MNTVNLGRTLAADARSIAHRAGRPASLAALALALTTPLATAAPPLKIEGDVRFVANRLLVQPRAGVALRQLDRVLGQHGARRTARIGTLDIHIVELPPTANERAVANLLRHHPLFKFAEIDQAVAHAIVTNDPNLASQWHHAKLGSSRAWDISAGDAVTVAVLDTGVDASHPDLAGSIVPGWNIYDNNADTRDVHGHGTAVAGTVAAVGNNGQGIAGLAWRARIMPVRIADPGAYATWSAMAQGISYAMTNGARVVNLSYQNSCGSSTVLSAAQTLRSRGGVVVISAGNTSGAISDAQSASVLCVAATDSADVRASWSSYGPAVDIAAPGVSILTTTNGGGYGGASGTSFAAPLAAGTYALMMSANWSLSPNTLDSILVQTAVDLGAQGVDQYYGAGRIDTATAVARALATVATDTTPPAVAITSPASGGRVNGIATVDVSASDAAGVERVELLVNGALLASDAVAPYGFAIDTTRYADGTVLGLAARAIDRSGNVGTTNTVNVTVANDAIPPAVRISNPADGSTVSGTVSVAVNASDNVAVSKVSLTIDGKLVAQASGSALAYDWGAGTRKGGRNRTTSSTLVATAEDPAGNRTSTTIRVSR